MEISSLFAFYWEFLLIDPNWGLHKDLFSRLRSKFHAFTNGQNLIEQRYCPGDFNKSISLSLSHTNTISNFLCFRGGRNRDRRRSPPRYSGSPPRHGRSRSRSRDYSPPKERRYSRLVMWLCSSNYPIT